MKRNFNSLEEGINMEAKINFSPPRKARNIFSYILKYKKQFIITALTGIFFNSAIVLGPIYQGKLLDAAIEGKSTVALVKAGLAFILITASFQLARFFKRYYVRDMANRISGDMRIGILTSILGKELSVLQRSKVGELMTRVVGDVDIVVEAIRKTITELWDTWVLMAAYFIALLFYDIKITLLAAIPIPLALLTAHGLKKIISKKSKEARKANSRTTLQIRKIINNTSLLRLYGREEAEVKRLSYNLKKQARATAIASVLKVGLAPIYVALSTMGILIVIGLGGKKVIDGSFTIGTFTAYITMFTALATRTTTAAKVFNIQQGAKPSWERIKELIGEAKVRFSGPYEDLRPQKIIVQNLSFSYDNEEKMALRDLSFSVEKGMIIGVTGSVGSGKSALGLALTGLYPYEGNILLDERELREVDNGDKLATIAYSGHNPFLFSSSIKENVTWGEDNPKELQRAVHHAALEKDLNAFEKNINTEVGERGAKVSGGQLQRISLARALYKASSILILDDPFSAVDINTEEELMKFIKAEAENKIIFILSHRLNNFKYMDKVLVLDKGTLVEEGTHEELMIKAGIYRKIIDSQKWIGGK